MTLKKRRIILICCTLFLLTAAPILLLYTSGYRITSRLKIVKTGGLFIYSSLKDSQIFINEKKKETGIFGSSIFLQNLTPKTYSVLVAKDGYYPWAKDLNVEEGFVTEARAFLTSKNPKGEILKENDIEDKEIIKSLENLLNIPDEFENEEKKMIYFSRFTKNQKQQLWWDPEINKVQVKWLDNQDSLPYYFCSSIKECGPLITILNPISEIRNVEFYPKRNDLILIAQQNLIGIIEIDGRGIRNWHPVYKGKEPVFITYKNKKTIYILDNENFLKIDLE